MFENKLVLTPCDGQWVADAVSLASAARSIGFAGEPYDAQDGVPAALIGDNFLKQFVFMGCSPHIEIHPKQEGDDAFCHIRFPAATLIPTLWLVQNARPPHCVACRKLIITGSGANTNFRSMSPETRIQCPSCQRQLSLSDLDWRKNGAFARTFIEITNVYPNEALPSEGLLQQFGLATSTAWSYFYL